jgi:hypothetical protein
MITPLDVLGQGLVKAYLEIEQPRLPDDQAVVPVKFNPTEYSIQKQNTYAEIGIPGLETPPIQFVRGASEKLSVELLVDTSDTLDDVRTKYVNRLRSLLNIQSELHEAFPRRPGKPVDCLHDVPSGRRADPRQT